MVALSDAETAELVGRVRAGDQEAWVQLTDRYTGLLWSIARAMRLGHADAGDAVQTTWLRLVERLDSLREPHRLGGWLATTMRHECLTILRRSARVQVGLGEAAEEGPADDGPLDEALLAAERDAALWRAFNALAARCQTLLRVLMADPPPAYADVSSALGMPVGSIGPTRQRCLNALRRSLMADATAGQGREEA